MQHANIDYVRTKLNELLRINDQPVISDSDTIVSKNVCRSDNINCIEKFCKICNAKIMLKACVAIFYQILFFHQMIALQKL